MTGVTPDPLDRLRQIAEAADNGSPWEWEHAYPQRITRVGDVVLVADCFEDPDSPSRFAEFIATFDPPTVLALLEVARAARVIRDTARWYGDNDARLAHEVDHALCVEVYSLADNALARLDEGAA